MNKAAHFFIIAPRCQVTAFTIYAIGFVRLCNPACNPSASFSSISLLVRFGEHTSIVAGEDANCNLRCNKSILINFRFVLANTQRMQYCTMRCNYTTMPQYNHATMPLVHPALQSKCKLKDHNRWLHLHQGSATETIVANHS